MKFTIFTPTFNRGEKLIRLYKSLILLNYKNFEWLIIDDGSFDNTTSIVRNFISENQIKIRYIYQENSGKSCAYNRAILEAESDLFLCIDSDDILKPFSLSILKENWEKLTEYELNFCGGMVFLDCDLQDNLIGSMLPTEKFLSSFELYHIYDVIGDKGLAFKTNILKNYSFPCFKDEKFVTEAVLYNRIARKYKLLCINEKLEIRDYQKDGLSAKYSSLLIVNPLGTALYYNELNFLEKNNMRIIKNNAVYIKYSLIGNIKFRKIYLEAIERKHFIFSSLIGTVFYVKYCLKNFEFKK